ncbi:MAG: tryptophan 2,3-dioxygenase family protein [Planctomycetes bacterium]|nr:tryptophan 2,3-dioxygenase family protein [Planctomycetota bacterium]
MPDPAPTYWDYLKLDQLLSLQGGLEQDERGVEPDELHFIIVHQAFELWFKLVLRELRLARDYLAAPRVAEEAIPHVVHHLGRVNEIFRLLVDQFAIMETLTPQDFLAFRDKLVPASGFQSFQMREIELVLGLEDAQRVVEGGLDPMRTLERMARESPGGAGAWAKIDAARAETSLLEGLRRWLHRTPIQGSSPGDPGDEAAVDAFLAEYLARLEGTGGLATTKLKAIPGADAAETDRRIAAGQSQARTFLLALDQPEAERARVKRTRAGLVFVESYRRLPLLAWPRLLIDTVVELEEQLVLWRTRHARMVERVIGRRVGTGGSSGVDYLDQTARYRIFGELWTVRTLLLPRDDLPPLERAGFYGFAV